MEKLKTDHIIFASAIEPKKTNTECFYCGTEYENGSFYCPTCGGSATTDMGYPKIIIAQDYDINCDNNFKPERAQEKRFGDFWRTVQRETSKATN